MGIEEDVGRRLRNVRSDDGCDVGRGALTPNLGSLGAFRHDAAIQPLQILGIWRSPPVRVEFSARCGTIATSRLLDTKTRAQCSAVRNAYPYFQRLRSKASPASRCAT